MIRLIAVGRLKDPNLRAGFDEYIKRLTGFTRVEVLELKNGKNPSDYIRPNDLVVALDEGGENLTSHALAELIKQHQLTKDIVFILGGPEGLDTTVLKKANLCLSLSKMTFTSQFARLLLGHLQSSKE